MEFSDLMGVSEQVPCPSPTDKSVTDITKIRWDCRELVAGCRDVDGVSRGRHPRFKRKTAVLRWEADTIAA